VNDKKINKPRCADCQATLKKSAKFCTNCGTNCQSLGKSFYSIPDPAERESTWNQAYEGGFIGKVARF
jgi:predicted amidophosphoribosyltransferase